MGMAVSKLCLTLPVPMVMSLMSNTKVKPPTQKSQLTNPPPNPLTSPPLTQLLTNPPLPPFTNPPTRPTLSNLLLKKHPQKRPPRLPQKRLLPPLKKPLHLLKQHPLLKKLPEDDFSKSIKVWQLERSTKLLQH